MVESAETQNPFFRQGVEHYFQLVGFFVDSEIRGQNCEIQTNT